MTFFFQRGLLLDVSFEWIFFSLSLGGSNIVASHSDLTFCRCHPPDCSLICGERKRPFQELWWQSISKNRGHKYLCNIYETALITDCFNPLLSVSLWSPSDGR